MARHYVTLEQANAMIPSLRQSFVLLYQLHIHVKQLMGELEKTGYAPKSDNFEVAIEGAPLLATAARGRLRAVIDLMRDELDHLRSRGCIVRDIESGNVSWYARHEQRGDYILSWRAGERQITHWIEVGSSNVERRPLSELDNVEASNESPKGERPKGENAKAESPQSASAPSAGRKASK